MKLAKQIFPYAIIAILIAVLFFTCNRRSDKDLPPTPDTQATLDSIANTYKDSMAVRDKNIDSLQALANFADMEKELLSAQLVSNGKQVTQLSNIIRALRKDSPITIYEQSCDSLALIAPYYSRLSDSFRLAVAEHDRLKAQEIAEWKQSMEDCDVAYLSAVDAAVKSNEALSAYKQATRPRASLYIGITGGTNFTQASAGPSLMYRGKGGKTMLGASYEVGNTKPWTKIGIYKRISFRR